MKDRQSTNKKPSYKRKMTDKRREQNRAAQKAYRAKCKERVAQLERRVDTLSGQSQNQGQENTFLESRSESLLRYSPENDADIEEIGGIVESSPVQPQDANPNMTALKALISNGDEEDADGLLQYALQEQLDVNKILLAGLRALKAEKEGTSIAPYTRRGVDWRPDLWPMPAVITMPLMPDPLASGILLRQQAPLEVCYHNCRKIGLRFEDMIQPGCRSPWYSPLQGPGFELLPLDGVPPDLYPTPAQRNIMHHPFWDIIPFPWIRERAITFAAMDSPPFDWHEFKYDIINGGMVCWKSRRQEEGLPWDRKCWEFRPWFRQKWGWLIEEQGKVEQQSKWWRAMAGAQET